MKKILIIGFFLSFIIMVGTIILTIELSSFSQPPAERIQKLICFIGSSTLKNVEYQNYIADHFDALVIGSGATEATQNIKKRNPDILTFVYLSIRDVWDSWLDYPTINTTINEPWFVHDMNGSDYTHRIYSRGYGTNIGYNRYLMDPSSGWADYWINKTLDILTRYPQFTSIHADNAACEVIHYYWNNTTPSEYYVPDVNANWHNGMINLLATTRKQIGHRLIANCGRFTDSGNASGISMWEAYIHGIYQDLYAPGYISGRDIFAIDRLHSVAKGGNWIVALCGTKGYPTNPTQADMDRLHQLQVFTLCCFLFTVEDMSKSYYGWNGNYYESYGGDPASCFFPEMNHIFGKPIDDYYQVGELTYARNFTNTIIFCNLSPNNSTTIIWNSNNYTLSPRSGLILDT